MPQVNYDERLERVLRALGRAEDTQSDRFADLLDSFSSLNAQEQESGKKVICLDTKPRTGSIKIIPLFDIHYGFKGCNRDKLQAYIDYILRLSDTYTILGGDSCETATRESIGLGLMEEELHTGDQRRQLTDMLRPLANNGKILGGVAGNHEMRAHRYNGDNPMEEICYDLGIDYCGYQGYFNIKVNGISYHVVVHHGVGSGSTKGGVVNAAAKPGNIALADLYISGHSHVRAAIDDAIYVIDDESNSLIKKRRVFVIGGSLVNYFGFYPEMKMLQPANMGGVLISLSGTQKYVSVTL